MSAPIRLEDLRCDACGSDQPMAFAPGTEEIREVVLLQREQPMRCVCLACWPVVKAA